MSSFRSTRILLAAVALEALAAGVCREARADCAPRSLTLTLESVTVDGRAQPPGAARARAYLAYRTEKSVEYAIESPDDGLPYREIFDR